MTTTTVKTQGTTLTWNSVLVGDISNVSGLSSPTNKIDIGSFGDTVVKTRPGRRKAGDFTFDINFNPDNTVQASLYADQITGVERTTILVVPEGTKKTITFSARVMNFTMSADDDNIYKGQVTLRVTSKPVRS